MDDVWRHFLPIHDDTTDSHWQMGHFHGFTKLTTDKRLPWPGAVAWILRTRMEIAMESIGASNLSRRTSERYGTIATDLMTVFLTRHGPINTIGGPDDITDKAKQMCDAFSDKLSTNTLDLWLHGDSGHDRVAWSYDPQILRQTIIDSSSPRHHHHSVPPTAPKKRHVVLRRRNPEVA